MGLTDRDTAVGILRAYEYHDGEWVEVAEGTNVLTNGYYWEVYAAIAASRPAFIASPILALGIGAGTITPLRTDTALVAEWKRYAMVASTVNVTDPASTVLSYYSLAADGTANITEAGIVMGALATTVPATGTLASHLAFTYSKLSSTDVRFDYTITRV